MRKTILILAVLCLSIIHTNAQEFMINNIAKGTTPTVASGGDMGQFTYTYHTTADDSLHFTLLDPRLSPMSTITLSTKGLGNVLSSSFNGQQIVILFYDANKKTATLVATDQEAKNIVKKTIKGINSAGDKVYILPSINPEKIILIHETNNGNGYTLIVYNNKLEEQLKKTGNKQIAEVRANMDVISIIAKNKAANGTISFSIVNIQSEEGEIMSEQELKDGNDVFYPNFFSTAEGMTYTGGVYFTNGKYSDKSPEGIYFSNITPEGTLEATMKTPYSTVIQDIKGGYAGKLASGEYKLMLHDGARRMNGSGFIISGEIYSVKRTANGDAIFKVYDMVSIKFDNEFKYKGTSVTKKLAKEAIVKGGVLKGNDIDVALWMKKMNFFDFKKYVDMGGTPNIIYTEIDDKQAIIAAKVPGDTTDAVPVSIVIDKLGMGNDAGTTTFNSDNGTLYEYGILPAQEPSSLLLYHYKYPSLVLWSTPAPANDSDPMNEADDMGIDNNHPGDEPRQNDDAAPEQE